jgi:hypothetical protein
LFNLSTLVETNSNTCECLLVYVQYFLLRVMTSWKQGLMAFLDSQKYFLWLCSNILHSSR